jgi:Domain of unknown function (DUF4365)
MILTENNIKAELSYAYLHAVASRAGLACEATGRHSDGAGVDAVIRAKERFAANSIYTDFAVDVQLKSTSAEPAYDARERYSFSLRRDHYEKLRNSERHAQLILVVLFLSPDASSWLTHTEDGLIARRCAYWVSILGAPESANSGSQTVYIPPTNLLSVEGLRSVMTTVSRGERIHYEL